MLSVLKSIWALSEKSNMQASALEPHDDDGAIVTISPVLERRSAIKRRDYIYRCPKYNHL